MKGVWVVTRPTKNGPVTSIELYDTNRDLLCQFFLSTQKIEKEQADKAKLIWQDYTDRLKQTLVGA